MLKKFYIIFFLTLFIFLYPGKMVAYATSQGEGRGASFGVRPIYPKGQIGGETGYFHLNVRPNDEKKLEVLVSNYLDKEITVLTERSRATTGDGGTVDYHKSKKEDKVSPKVDFEEISELEHTEIHLKGKEQKKVTLTVKIPAQTFDGQVLGGLHFSEKNAGESERNNKTIVNVFSYSIAVLLTETDKKIENNIELVNVFPSQRNYRNYIESTIQNKAAITVNRLEVEATVYKQGTKEIAYSVKNNENMRMAPESSFDFGIDLQDSPLIAGDYTMQMKLIADGKSYDFKKDFSISKKEMKRYNEQSVFLKQKPKNTQWMWWIISLFIGVGIIFGIIYTYRKHKKKKRLLEQRKRRKKKMKK